MLVILVPCVIAMLWALLWVGVDERAPLSYLKIVTITAVVEVGFEAVSYWHDGPEKFIAIAMVTFTALMFVVIQLTLLLRRLVLRGVRGTGFSAKQVAASGLFGLYLYVLLVMSLISTLPLDGFSVLQAGAGGALLYGAIRGAAGQADRRWRWAFGGLLLWCVGMLVYSLRFDFSRLMVTLIFVGLMLPALMLNLKFVGVWGGGAVKDVA
jgi:hypothetical protein